MRKTGSALLAAALTSIFFAGCVERALVITTDPPGADVVVNQQWKGKSPYVLPFKHYGVYDIWIEHPGYEENGKTVKFYPMHVGEPVKAPGYQYPGADFVSEVLLPTTLRDRRDLHYTLERVDRADDIDDVLSRAKQLRDARALRGQMRMEKDIQLGRIEDPNAPAAVEPPVEYIADGVAYDAVPVPAPAPAVEYHYQEALEYGDIDATPPLPSELPVFGL